MIKMKEVKVLKANDQTTGGEINKIHQTVAAQFITDPETEVIKDKNKLTEISEALRKAQEAKIEANAVITKTETEATYHIKFAETEAENAKTKDSTTKIVDKLDKSEPEVTQDKTLPTETVNAQAMVEFEAVKAENKDASEDPNSKDAAESIKDQIQKVSIKPKAEVETHKKMNVFKIDGIKIVPANKYPADSSELMEELGGTYFICYRLESEKYQLHFAVNDDDKASGFIIANMSWINPTILEIKVSQELKDTKIEKEIKTALILEAIDTSRKAGHTGLEVSIDDDDNDEKSFYRDIAKSYHINVIEYNCWFKGRPQRTFRFY